MPIAALCIFLLAGLAAASGAPEGCDCRKPLAFPSKPVQDDLGITYQNSCVAECQGVIQYEELSDAVVRALSFKARSVGEVDPTPAPTVDYTKVDSTAEVGPEVLNLFRQEGYRFSATVLTKEGLGQPRRLAQGDDNSPRTEQPANRAMIASKLTSDGHLYLKAVLPEEGAAQQRADSAFTPGRPGSKASAEEAEGAMRRRMHGRGRRLKLVGRDDRVEISSDAYPWSTVGALLAFEPVDNLDVSGFFGSGASAGQEQSVGIRICTATLISKKHILTAGHCVYDSGARQFYDLKQMAFFPNLHGGPPRSQREAESLLQVPLVSAMTYFNQAGRPSDCPDGSKAECQSSEDFLYDFAVVTLAEEIGDEFGFLGYGYQCGVKEYKDVYTAGYPGDRKDSPFRMYKTSGNLDPFDACGNEYRNGLVSSDLDTYQGQSGSAIWEGGTSSDVEKVVRALVNGGTDTIPIHRTITAWVYQEILKEVEGQNDPAQAPSPSPGRD